jgi:hypothetical WD-repeat protein
MRRFPRKIVAATTLGVLTLARLRHARRRGLVRAITTFTTPDGKPWVVTLGRGRFVSVWDAGSGRRLRRLPVSDGPVHVAAFASSTGAPRLAVLAGNRSIQLWDPETGDRVGELRVSETAPGSRLVTWRTPSGRPRVAVICGDGGIRVLDPEAGEGNEVPLIGHEGAAADLATWRTPDGQLRLASSGNGVTLLWDPETGREVGRLEGPRKRLSSVTAHTAPERTLLVVIDKDGGYTLWDPDVEQQVASHRLPVGLEPGLAVPLPRLRIATGHRDGTVRVTDPATGDQLHETRFRRPVRAIAALPDGVLVGLDNGWRTVRLAEDSAT